MRAWTWPGERGEARYFGGGSKPEPPPPPPPPPKKTDPEIQAEKAQQRRALNARKGRRTLMTSAGTAGDMDLAETPQGPTLLGGSKV